MNRNLKNGESYLKKFNHRKYHLVSQFCPDQSFIIRYLIQHKFHTTLLHFRKEIQKNNQPTNAILELFDKQDTTHFNAFIQQINSTAHKNTTPNILRKLIFYLYVWRVSIEPNQPEPLQGLKRYIQQKGEQLSAIPQLLPYFALPYLKQAKSHPFLATIFTAKWKSELRKLLVDVCQISHNFEQQSPDADWFLIVNDLLQISTSLISELNEDKRYKVKNMIDRILDYTKVLKQNEWKENELKESEWKENELKESEWKENEWKENEWKDKSQIIAQLKSQKCKLKVFEKLVKKQKNVTLDFLLLKKTIISNQDQNTVCGILEALRKRLKYSTISQRKILISQISKNDILSIKGDDFIMLGLGSQNHSLRKSLLKFIAQIAQTYHGRHYLSTSSKLLPITIDMLTLKQNHLISICLSILYRLSSNREVCDYLAKQTVLLRLDYLLGSEVQENCLTYCIALLTNILLTQKGRVECGKTCIFQTLLKLIVGNKNRQKEFQQFVNACIYSLVFEEIHKEKAKQLKLQEILIKKSSQKQDPQYTRQVEYILEKLHEKDCDKQVGKEQEEEDKEQNDNDIDISISDGLNNDEDILLQYAYDSNKITNLPKVEKVEQSNPEQINFKPSRNPIKSISSLNYKKENYEWRNKQKTNNNRSVRLQIHK